MKVVFDSPCNNTYGEKIFSYEFGKKIIGCSWLSCFYNLAQESNIQKFSHKDVIVLEANGSSDVPLLRTGAYPLIIFSGESPNVDWQFYLRIHKNSKPYKHAFLFSGFQKYLPKDVTYHPFYWPNNPNNIDNSEKILSSKDSRKKLVMLLSNKKAKLSSSATRLIRTLGMTAITTFIPKMKLTDLCPFRMKAMVYFSKKNYFDLYGMRWDNRQLFTKEEHEAVKKLNPTKIDDKYATLAKYQFSLCFENCVYPGYVTEKIFDCFLAKCIPIYYGAPDIDQYVPKDTFIDMRHFKTFEALAFFIEQLSSEEIDNYLRNIEKYLKSHSFLKFTDQYFANKVFDIVHEHFLLNEKN